MQKNVESLAYVVTRRGVFRSHFGPLQAQIDEVTQLPRLRLLPEGIKMSFWVANMRL